MNSRCTKLVLSLTCIGAFVGCSTDEQPSDSARLSDGAPVEDSSDPRDWRADRSLTDAPADSGADATPVVPKGARMLGIAVNEAVDPKTGQTEPYDDAYAYAARVGIDFLTLPVDWRAIEPGPDDDFRSPELDGQRWTSSSEGQQLGIVQPPTTNRPLLRFTQQTPTTGHPFVAAKYQLAGDDVRVTTDVALPQSNVDGCGVALLLRLADGDSTRPGNRCSDATDNFGTVMLKRSGGKLALWAIACKAGQLDGPRVLAASQAEQALRLSFGKATVQAEARSVQGNWRTVGTFKTADFGGAVGASIRPYIVFDAATTGAGCVAEVGGFRVAATPAPRVVFDDPTDRYREGLLGIANLVYSQLGVELGLSLRPINTTRAEVPSDLAGVDPLTSRVDFARQDIRDRFRSFIDYVLEKLPDVKIVSLSLGNEIDVYLGHEQGAANTRAWDSYITFFKAAAAHAKSRLRPHQAQALVGAKATLEGLLSNEAGAIERRQGRYHAVRPSLAMRKLFEIGEQAGGVLATYYPLKDGDGLVRDPEVVQDDFDKLADIYGEGNLAGKPIHLLEVGYPSAAQSVSCPLCNSSEAKQARFYEQLFRAWDRHAAKIPLVNITWLTDISSEALAGYAEYYGSDAPLFVEFLRTLGLRAPDGTVKAAYDRVLESARARGWTAR